MYSIHLTTDHIREPTKIRGTTFLALWHTEHPSPTHPYRCADLILRHFYIAKLICVVTCLVLVIVHLEDSSHTI